MNKDYMIYKLSETVKETSRIDSELFKQYGVKRGLRNEDHSGVLVGLTNIGDVVGYERLPDGGGLKAIPGKLIYRGIDIVDLVRGVQASGVCGFEETAFLLMSGYLPDQEELDMFTNLLTEQMVLRHVTKMNILSLYGNDIMNIMARSVLVLYAFDENAENTSRENLVRQSIDLIAKFPAIVAYAYHTMNHNKNGGSLHIRIPKTGVSLAENFLYMMKGSKGYTPLDVKILDLCLMLHADHGGGNNSTFTTRVTSSSGTDTYSSIAAAIGSLKGPLHGGANLQVIAMFAHLREAIENWEDRTEVKNYLMRILRKEVYKKNGLIYGIGHAVYTVSDPRALLLKEMARSLATEKGMEKEFAFLELVEELGVESFMEFKGTAVNKSVCANVDFYSGFVYEMIGLPQEVFTPLFAMSRVAGWVAHRIEELNFDSKRIIRPAYKNVAPNTEYKPLNKR